jgi:hypothetical protein
MAALVPATARPRPLSWPAVAVVLLQLLLLLLGPPAARARSIKYFDLESRRLPLPDPPGLVLGPMGNNTLRETRDIVVLADGASSALPMQAWDAAVLRTFVVEGGHHQFLTLLNAGTERVFHLDLGAMEFDLNQKRVSSGGMYMYVSDEKGLQSTQHRNALKSSTHAISITTHRLQRRRLPRPGHRRVRRRRDCVPPRFGGGPDPGPSPHRAHGWGPELPGVGGLHDP